MKNEIACAGRRSGLSSERTSLTTATALFLFFWAMLLAGCTTCVTTYQAKGKGVMGYYEQQLSPERWEIHFNAERQTEWDAIDQYLRKRAGELASSQGWKGYTIIAQYHEKVSDLSDQSHMSQLPAPGVDYPVPGVGVSNGNPSQTLNAYQIPFSYRHARLVIAPVH